MALTRNYLKGMGLDDEKIDAIIDQHSETVTALKADREKYKTDAEKLAEVQKELDDLKAKGDGGWQKKYEDEHTAFEAYKTAQTDKETLATKTEAYKALLAEAGVSEKFHKVILKASDLKALELDAEGKLKDAKVLTDTIKADYADFITNTNTSGANTTTPPENNVGGITKEAFDKMGYQARLDLYNENPELYNTLKGE